MQFGEKLIQDNGVVTGDDTGRLVAKFSHKEEAESFCEAANTSLTLPKIVQILIGPNDNNYQGRLLGLDSNGLVWASGKDGWSLWINAMPENL